MCAGGRHDDWHGSEGGRSGDGSAPHQGSAGEPEGGEWEENGWVWDDKEQAWRTRREDGSWEWEWEVEESEPAAAEQAEDSGEWVRIVLHF